MDWITLGAAIKKYSKLNNEYQNKLIDLDNIKSAIENKGVTVGDIPTSEYSKKVDEISGNREKIFYSSSGVMHTENMIFSNGTTSIESTAYRYCYNIKSITTANSITSIGTNAFQGCTSLTNIYLTNRITSIASNSFASCKLLSFVSLESNFNCSLNISAGSYSVDVILAMFNALKDNTGTTAKTLTLGTTNLAKLTEEQKQIATNKNWNLA
ncbi:MAG: leucine-rich repeat domain-containing protein [Ruminococcus sp.]|nr:leucine-rich repeat domain-containing protein [Ruminococcus sp.]